MPRASRTVSEADWERHGDTITRLYHVERLRLHGNDGQPSVQQVMRDEYGFDASVFQYEKFFRAQQRPKNLKREEWRAVGARLHQLHAKGLQTRIKVSGQICSKGKVDRALRHAFSDLGGKFQSTAGALALPPANRVLIEIRRTDDDAWSTYVVENIASADQMPAPTTSPATLGLIKPSAAEFTYVGDEGRSLADIRASASTTIDAHFHSLGGFSLMDQVLEFQDTPLSPSLDMLLYGSGSPLRHSSNSPMLPRFDAHSVPGPEILNFNHSVDMDYFPSGCIRRLQIPGQSPIEFNDDLGAAATFTNKSPIWQPSSPQIEPSSPGVFVRLISPEFTTSGLNETFASSPHILIQALLKHAAQFHQDSKPPHLDKLMNMFLCRLPDGMINTASGQGLEIAARGFMFDSPVYTSLIWSIANGFAGLEAIPPAAILKTLMQEIHLSDQLLRCLRLYPPSLKRALADNLFRAAVESLDGQAVRVILQTTHESGITIEPDEIVCGRGAHERYTPIEFAAMHHHVEMVQLLVDMADVNKTYATQSYEWGGALEHAIRSAIRHKVAVEISLIQSLLNHKAKIQSDLVDSFVMLGQENLVSELVSRPASHRHFFEQLPHGGKTPLAHVAFFLTNSFATQVFKKIFMQCQAENCMNYIANNKTAIDSSFYAATRRGNLELVELLLPHTECKDAALSAAIRIGRSDLVDLMFKEGARISVAHRPSEYLGRFHDGNGLDDQLSTPLAEAFRAQDEDLVQKLEQLGASSYLDQKEHFEAAMISVVEVGNYRYMEMMLKDATREMHNECLSVPLHTAINKDMAEAVQILLSNGASPGITPHGFDLRDRWAAYPLVCALRKRNRVIFDAILDSGVSLVEHSESADFAMEEAGLWGEISILDDLILMGADIDGGRETTALAVAVKTRNRILVHQLLERGASLNPDVMGASLDPYAKIQLTPLTIAVRNEDNDMVQLLLSKGADLVDKWAFLSAIKTNSQTLNMLLEMFSTRYPEGKIGFGRDILVEAVKMKDGELLRKILRAKFDVNARGKRPPTNKYGDTASTHTALGFAVSQCQGSDFCLVQELIKHGGDVDGICGHALTLWPLPMFIDSADEVWSLETPLMVAIKTKNVQMVEMLLEKRADPCRPARRGIRRTPLQLACEIDSIEIIHALLDKGARVDEQPAMREGGTALQLTAINGNTKIANLLLERGASIHETQSWGKYGAHSAFEGAAKNGRMDMIRLLWNESQKASSKPFATKLIQNAISLAKEQGHNGCAEYITSLWSVTGVDFFLS